MNLKKYKEKIEV